MQFSLLALAAISSLVSAQNFSGEPACATSCLSSAIAAASCGPTDVSCQCNLSPAAVGPCLLSACNATDVALAASVGSKLCSAFSATHTNGTVTVVSSTSYMNTSTTVVTAKTTSVPLSTTTTGSSSKTGSGSATAASTSSSAPKSSSSSGAAPSNGLVAGIGGVLGMVGLLAAW